MAKQMSNCCYIQNLDKLLDEINVFRIKSNERKILRKDWSNFLSGLSANKVRQHWINLMLKGKCVQKDKALVLLSATNAVRRKYGQTQLDESVLICDDPKEP